VRLSRSPPEEALTELAAWLEVREAGPRVELWVPAEEVFVRVVAGSR
jgi:hypothetical protein